MGRARSPRSHASWRCSGTRLHRHNRRSRVPERHRRADHRRRRRLRVRRQRQPGWAPERRRALALRGHDGRPGRCVRNSGMGPRPRGDAAVPVRLGARRGRRKLLWPGLASLAMVESTLAVGGKTLTERRYFATRLAVDAETLARAVRGHWSVEHGLHWTRSTWRSARTRAGHVWSRRRRTSRWSGGSRRRSSRRRRPRRAGCRRIDAGGLGRALSC